MRLVVVTGSKILKIKIMKRGLIFISLATIALLGTIVSSCSKEDLDTDTSTVKGLRLATENYNNGAKAYLNDNHVACWESGDSVEFSHTPTSGSVTNHAAAVNIQYDNSNPVVTASVSDGTFNPTDGSVYGGYPRSMFSSGVGESNTITMPASYDYVTTNGHQKLECPMIGYCEISGENSVITFKNVCTLIKLTIGSTSSEDPSVIGGITVTASGDNHLSGSHRLTYQNRTPALQYSGDNAEADKSLSINFGGNAVSLAAGETKTIYIPIPQVSQGCTLTFKVHDNLADKDTTKSIRVANGLNPNTYCSLNYGDISSPSAYTFYDWLHNYNPENSSVIDLGVKPTNTSKMEMRFRAMKPKDSQYYSGSALYGGILWFGISGSSSDNYLLTHFCDEFIKSTITRDALTDGEPNKYMVTCEVKHISEGYYLASTFQDLTLNLIDTKNSETKTNGINSSEAPTIKVFALREGKHNPGMKLYSYRVWDNGSLTHNFVPAVKHVAEGTDSIGVYNMVTNKFIRCDRVTEGTTKGDHFCVGND